MQNIDVDKQIKANFIDLHRAICLNNLTKIDCITREKYGYPLKFDSVLYTDFDIDPIKHLQSLKITDLDRTLLVSKIHKIGNNIQEDATNFGIRVLPHLTKKTKDKSSIIVEVEPNVILHPKHLQYSSWSLECGGLFAENVENFLSMIEKELINKINGIKLEFPLSAEQMFCDDRVKNLKYSEGDVGAIFSFQKEHLEDVIKIINEFQMGDLEKSNDYTWKKAVEEKILQSSNLRSTKIHDATTTEAAIPSARGQC